MYAGNSALVGTCIRAVGHVKDAEATAARRVIRSTGMPSPGRACMHEQCVHSLEMYPAPGSFLRCLAVRQSGQAFACELADPAGPRQTSCH